MRLTDVQKRTVVVLLILTVVVAILGTLTILQKTTAPEDMPLQEAKGTANIYLEIREPANAPETQTGNIQGENYVMPE